MHPYIGGSAVDHRTIPRLRSLSPRTEADVPALHRKSRRPRSWQYIGVLGAPKHSPHQRKFRSRQRDHHTLRLRGHPRRELATQPCGETSPEGAPSCTGKQWLPRASGQLTTRTLGSSTAPGVRPCAQSEDRPRRIARLPHPRSPPPGDGFAEALPRRLPRRADSPLAGSVGRRGHGSAGTALARRLRAAVRPSCRVGFTKGSVGCSGAPFGCGAWTSPAWRCPPSERWRELSRLCAGPVGRLSHALSLKGRRCRAETWHHHFWECPFTRPLGHQWGPRAGSPPETRR